MRIISIANQKGGVGKTTTAVNLAGILAEKGNRVVLIDLDPQAHMTTFLGLQPDEVEKGSYEVLTRSCPLGDALIQVRDNVHLLASGLDLAAAEQELVAVVGRETILRDALEDYQDKFDYVFIDCPPSLGLLTLNALGAATELFIPLQPHFLSLQGLSQLLESVLLVHKRINPKLVISGLLFCMFDGRLSLSAEIVGDIEGFFRQQRELDCPWNNITIFKTRIRRNIKLAESPSYGKTIVEYERNCNGSQDYCSLADEVEMMGKSQDKAKAVIKVSDAELNSLNEAHEHLHEKKDSSIVSLSPKSSGRSDCTVKGHASSKDVNISAQVDVIPFNNSESSGDSLASKC